MRRTLGVLAVVVLAGAVSVTGQQAPRAAAPPAYRAPRTPDNHPDLQGIWQVLNSAEVDLLDHAASLGLPAGYSVVEGNEIPYLPAALAQKQKNFANRAKLDPNQKCFYPGVPRLTYMPFPFKITQTNGYAMFLYEFGHHTRIVYTDGTPFNVDIPAWMGDSRGRWEGETFVVETKNFTNESWFDRAGDFHSDALHVVERYTRTDTDHIQYEATITDPKTFSRPWKISMPLYRRVEPGAKLIEYECYALQVLEGGLYDEMIKNSKPPTQ